jgi:hypothetical protein
MEAGVFKGRFGFGRLEAYTCVMTKEQIQAALDRVLTWPLERQEEVARMIASIEEQDRSAYRLTDEQLAEVRRRRSEPSPDTLSFEEFAQRLDRFGV